MLNDDIFGQIQFEIMWQKKDNYFLYGKEFELSLIHISEPTRRS